MPMNGWKKKRKRLVIIEWSLNPFCLILICQRRLEIIYIRFRVYATCSILMICKAGSCYPSRAVKVKIEWDCLLFPADFGATLKVFTNPVVYILDDECKPRILLVCIVAWTRMRVWSYTWPCSSISSRGDLHTWNSLSGQEPTGVDPSWIPSDG